MKTCIKCEVAQPLNNFYTSHKNGRTYRRGECKQCVVVKNAAWRAANPEKRKGYEASRRKRLPEQVSASVRRTRQKRRNEALDALGGRCVGCGLDDRRVLQIDHVLNNGSEERRTMDASAVNRRVVLHPDEYQALCANCHVLKTLHGASF